ncbi:hypothetical protein ACFVH4_25570 [Nocardia ignorata]|uniref:hypothetical protein n=1 Tax=Nocardia ignorata TaxID=145285 RepID=UPI003638F528
MATISHVRACQPLSMVTYGSHLAAQNTFFAQVAEQVERDVDSAMDGWQGDAAAAASGRAVADKLSATNIDEVTTRLIGHYKSFGGNMEGIRAALLRIVDDEVLQAGMTVSDDGTVTAPTVPGSATDTTTLILQMRLDGQAAGYQTRIKELLHDFGLAELGAVQAIQIEVSALQVLAKSPAAPIPEPPTIVVDGQTYKIGLPEMPHLSTDQGFVPGSATPGIGDYISAAKWKAMLNGGELGRSDLDDSTAAYRHYWESGGTPFEFDYEEAYREDPNIKAAVDSEITRAAMAADALARDGNTNFQMTGTAADIGGAGGDYPATENWQKTIGAYQQWSHSNVRVEGDRVVMDVTVEAMDYYNFNQGAEDLATGASDNENGRFAELGWAHDFETNGKVTRTVSWELGQPLSTATVSETSVTERNPGREDRVDNRDSSGPRTPVENNDESGRPRK